MFGHWQFPGNGWSEPPRTSVSLALLSITGVISYSFYAKLCGIVDKKPFDTTSLERMTNVESPSLSVLQRMQPFQVECNAYQSPLTCCGPQTTQRELPEPQNFLDDANDSSRRVNMALNDMSA